MLASVLAVTKNWREHRGILIIAAISCFLFSLRSCTSFYRFAFQQLSSKVIVKEESNFNYSRSLQIMHERELPSARGPERNGIEDHSVDAVRNQRPWRSGRRMATLEYWILHLKYY